MSSVITCSWLHYVLHSHSLHQEGGWVQMLAAAETLTYSTHDCFDLRFCIIKEHDDNGKVQMCTTVASIAPHAAAGVLRIMQASVFICP